MKKLVAMLLAGAMVISMVACSNKDAGDDTKKTESAGTQSEDASGDNTEDEAWEGTLGVRFWGSQTRTDLTMKILDMYKADHPGIEFDVAPVQWSDYWTKLSTEATGKAVPDITAMDYKYINQFGSNGSLAALDSYVEDGTLKLDDVSPAIIDSGRYDGTLYAVCSGVNCPALLYDVDVVEQAGVEIKDNMTLDEFKEVCKKIYEETGVYTRLQYRAETFLQFFLRGNGVKLFNEENNAFDCTEEDLVAYFELFEEGVADGWLIPQTVFSEIDPNTVEQDPLVYGSVRSWCALAWSNQATAYTNANKEMNIAMTTWPAKDVKAANYIKPSQFWSVSANSVNEKESVKVIDYITNSVDCNNVLLAEKGIPISASVAEAIAPNLDEVQQAVTTLLNDVVTPNSSAIDPAAPSTAAEMYVLVDQLVEEICYGQNTPAEAAATLMEQGNTILAGN